MEAFEAAQRFPCGAVEKTPRSVKKGRLLGVLDKIGLALSTTDGNCSSK